MFVVAMGFASCFAQLSGSRDLTTFWRAPDDHVPAPSSDSCPAVKSTISGGAMVNGVPTEAAAAERPRKIELAIVRISPAKLQVGRAFTATIRLKNAGAAALRIPWQPDGEGVVHASADGTEQYEVADVSFRLAAVGKSGPATPLESEGALFAQPSDSATYLSVAPGQWVQITLKGTVACGLLHCVGDIKPTEHAMLTAWWYQRVLTHRVNGCTENHGAYTVRELDSAPMPVVVQPQEGSGRGNGHTESPNSSPGEPLQRVLPQIQSIYPSRNSFQFPLV